MNSYEQKQEARRERLLNAADKAQGRSDSAYKRSHDATKNIPFGQPILVGHHSESAHRGAIKRAHNAMDKCVSESKKADYYASKAAGVGTAGISSDDPDAVVKLKEKLAGLERKRDFLKATNKIVNRKPKGKETPEKLEELGKMLWTLPQAKELFAGDFCGRIGIASYQFSNLSGNIRRVKQRIEALAVVEDLESFSMPFDGGRIDVNYEDNRVQVFHDEKPDADIRGKLKHRGFKWSRYNTCWQRHISNVALWSAKEICGLDAA